MHDLVTKAATLTPRKIATICALSREMIESSNIEALATNALLRSIGLALDAVLFDATAADAIRPAGLRAGITALTASSATTADEAMVSDLENIGGAVVSAFGGEPVYVASPKRALGIQLRARRSPFLYQVLASPALAAGDVIAVNPVGLASAVADMPAINSSKVATLHEEDTTPLPIVSGGTVAAPTRSLMQTDSTGIRFRFDADWVLRDQRAVAWTTATAW